MKVQFKQIGPIKKIFFFFIHCKNNFFKIKNLIFKTKKWFFIRTHCETVLFSFSKSKHERKWQTTSSNREYLCFLTLIVRNIIFVPRIHVLFLWKKCNIDITAHLKSVKVAAEGFRNFSRSPVTDNGGQLILNRVGLFYSKLYTDIFVCPAYRFKLGIYFKQKKPCQFPDHKGKGKVYRGISLEESE